MSAISEIKDINLVILGNPESEEYLNTLQKQYICDIPNNVVIMSAVSHDVLWKYIGAVDLCVAPIVPNCRS